MQYVLIFICAALGSIIYQFYCETVTLRKFKVSSQESYDRVLGLVISSFPYKLLTAMICSAVVTTIAGAFNKLLIWIS